jgi:hypothetical protein
MRVYIPATLAGLADGLDVGHLPRGPAYAVTPGLRAWVVASGDGPGRGAPVADEADEELEFVALSEAARHCLRILDISSDADVDSDSVRAVRVVLVADVPDSTVSIRDDDPGAVTLTEQVLVSRIVSAHVDGDGAMPGVIAAIAAVRAADAGDQAAEAVVDAVDDLLWYAPEELRSLVRRG